MKISIFAGVLLLSAALMVLGPEPADAQFVNANSFEYKHINPRMTPGSCTNVMYRRINRHNNN
ncbi:hypothetical protein PFLUV_G00092560 [Perca fluviatilis]|uniref:Uncharacterized protein n=1 Tax=Perca fluviatilis TaxID=8168 RepID=A0A6A5FCU6_PERFL|nr:hypothetical protein PFLUV_G00092560 [Perca fluviatilis]